MPFHHKISIKAPDLNFKETIFSHGWVFLKPFYWDNDKSELTLKTLIDKSKKAILSIKFKNGFLLIKINAFRNQLTSEERSKIKGIVRHIFRLDEDFGGFYEICRNDPQLNFVSKTNSGRLLRSPTVFEDIIKTICTTNCSWSNTKMMVSNLCDLDDGFFPSPKTIQKAGIKNLQNKCRVGYRAKPIYEFSERVNNGGFDPDSLLYEQNIDQIKETLLSFNGIGNYSANHILMLLGYYSEIPVDSEVTSYICDSYFNGKRVSEKEIACLFEKYGEWKFLAYKFQRIGKKLNYIN
jgi:3-methyladenine DNA glycosylase/8-oxoguanine DNA glycosylase